MKNLALKKINQDLEEYYNSSNEFFKNLSEQEDNCEFINCCAARRLLDKHSEFIKTKSNLIENFYSLCEKNNLGCSFMKNYLGRLK
jgi:hypothetical protein